MRFLQQAVAVAGSTALAVVALGSPAAAGHQCATEPICLVTDEVTVPVGTPVIAPTGHAASSVFLTKLCNTSGGGCSDVFLDLPGAFVSSAGTTIATVTVPALGVSVDAMGRPTVWYGVPSVTTPFDPEAPFGIRVDIDVTDQPIRITPGGPVCEAMPPTLIGPVSLQSTTGCYIRVTILV